MSKEWSVQKAKVGGVKSLSGRGQKTEWERSKDSERGQMTEWEGANARVGGVKD